MVNEDDSSVGNAAFESCVSPKQYANLTDGLYDFSVKGTDRVGEGTAHRQHRSTVCSCLYSGCACCSV